MAFTSSSSSPPNHTHASSYDVFLSFRGEDTRNTFTDHLYHALLRAALRTFRDNDEIDRGEELKPEIETAIVKSRASIVVLSENYANSRWCIDELWLIMEQRRKCNHFVLPVFYHVDPSDVRNQRGSFAIEGSKLKMDDVRRWKGALTEVANLTGMALSGSEMDCITAVVDTIQCKLDLKLLSIPGHLTGMETRIEVISSWLKNEQYNAITICGMGGSGKTTLAQCIYNLYKQDFESSSFVEEIGKHYKHGLLELQKQLLRDVSRGKEIRISSVCEGTQKIVEVLRMKKVLIVLDDIDDQDELNALLGTKAFPTQSKIIITTRLLDIHAWFRSITWRCWVHKPELLNDLESLELLSWHAFRSKTPMEGFEELTIQLAAYCGGNPLALKVLGSSLRVTDEEPHKRNSMIEIWRERMDSLNSQGDLDCKIQDVLRKSFDSLPLDTHKQLFLDIACFFVGESKYMVTILRGDLYAKYGIMTLINKCLLTVSPDTGNLMMHQLLQDMGRKIVYDESTHPLKRSRIWNDDESYYVLRKGDVSDTIEGLALNIRKVEEGMRSEALALKTSSLTKMDKLKFLRLKFVKLTGSYENFPELRGLFWHGFPLQKIPSGLFMSSLVAIDMSYGVMEKFEAPAVLNSLKILNLTSCHKLVSICNFHQLPKLETLMLRNCYSLSYICKSIGDLNSLANLYLTRCTKLWRASSSNDVQPLLSLPQSVMVLDLNSCDLRYNNDVHLAFHAQSLFNLFLWDNPFAYLPSNINLNMLRKLILYSCTHLKSLPCIPSMLDELNIDLCVSLERITFQSGRFSLQTFDYRCCFKLCEVQGLFKLVPIAKLDEVNLGHMKWIKAYQDQQVDLVGDRITEARYWPIQMLYEYGIMSTYLQGMKYQSMLTDTYTSSSGFVSFHVPLHKKKHTIQGLHVSCLYRSSRSQDKDMWLLLARISNRTKRRTWVYNPMVYCKPCVDEDAVWLSYWPIGSILDAGDEVHVDIIVDGAMIVSKCGASLVYMDGELEEDEICESKTMKGEEVIGGDLSEFEVTAGGYYLCRRDLFGSETKSWLSNMFGDNVRYTESQGWRKTRQSRTSMSDLSTEIVLKVSFSNGSRIPILKRVANLAGIESVEIQEKIGRLIVTGYVDPVVLVKHVRRYSNAAEIVSVHPYFRQRPVEAFEHLWTV